MTEVADSKTTSDNTNNHAKQTKIHEATMKLMEQEKHIQVVKNRCTVLKVQEQKNRYRTLQQERKIKEFEHIRDEVAQDKVTSQRMLLSRLHEVEEQKSRNVKLRTLNEEKVKAVKEEVVQKKVEENQHRRVQSHKNQEKIQMMKKIDFQESQKRRLELKKIEELQKMHIKQFHTQRASDIQSQKNQYVNGLISKLKQSEQNFDRLAGMEQEMLRKHAQSVRASQLMRNKLKSVMHTSKIRDHSPTNRSADSENQNRSLDRYTLQV